MSTTTATVRKIDRCAIDLGNTPQLAASMHSVWRRLFGAECRGAGQCDAAAFAWTEWEARLADKRTARRLRAAVRRVEDKAAPTHRHDA